MDTSALTHTCKRWYRASTAAKVAICLCASGRGAVEAAFRGSMTPSRAKMVYRLSSWGGEIGSEVWLVELSLASNAGPHRQRRKFSAVCKPKFQRVALVVSLAELIGQLSRRAHERRFVLTKLQLRDLG